MKIIILGDSIGFPIGLASTARVRCIAKALASEGHRVEVLNLVGISKSYTNSKVPSIGCFEGIFYRFCGFHAVRPGTKIGRFLEKILGNVVSIFFIIFRKLRKEIDCIILYTRNPSLIVRFGIISKLLQIPIIVEVCEWPMAIAITKGYGFSKGYKFKRALAKYADGVIPISTYISQEIEKCASERNISSLIVPIMFDEEPDKEKTHGFQALEHSYIFYSGSADYENIWKLIIDAFFILYTKGVHIPLFITCPGRESSVNALLKYIKDKKLFNTIKYLGYVEDNDFYRLIANATILLAPLPNDLQTIARFPTKLAFYLASGRPVITTKIGDITKYLCDEENAYLTSRDCTPEELANKILNCLSNLQKAEKVGLEGKKVAWENFYYKSQSKKLSDFIINVVNSKRYKYMRSQ